MIKKIVIIGANSYIARNLYKVLLDRTYSSNYCFEIKLYDRESFHKDNSNDYIQANICDEKDFSKIDVDCDIIFMFVGKTGSINGFEDYNSFIDINEIALLNLLSIVKNNNSKAKIVFPSTRLVYKGKTGQLSEDSEKEFKTIYAMNKWSCENYLKQFNNVYGINYLILRICLPYGTLIQNASSYGTADFMLKKAKAKEPITLYGNGNQRRTVTYIKDLADAIIDSAFSNKCINDVYNIGGEDYSLKEMAVKIADKFDVEIKYMDWPEQALAIESGDTVFNSDKLDKIIGKHDKMHFSDWIKEV